MPTYVFEDKETGNRIEVLMKYADMENFLKENPGFKHVIQAPALVSMVGGYKVDDGFRERMSKIKETYKVNNIPDY